MTERPYVPDELKKLTKDGLCKLIERQIERWPKKPGQKLTTHKALMRLSWKQLYDGLLLPELGFTTPEPLPSSTAGSSTSGVGTPQTAGVDSTLINAEDPSATTTSQPTSGDISANSLVYMQIAVFIEYKPPPPGFQKQAIDVYLPAMTVPATGMAGRTVVPDAGKAGGKVWVIQARDLCEALQKSNARIVGHPVSISHDHHSRAAFKVVFAAHFDPSKSELTEYCPEWLRVPDHREFSLEVVRLTTELPAENTSDTSVNTYIAKSEPTLPSKKAARPRESIRRHVVDLLKQELRSCEGFEAFEEHRNRTVQNSLVVADWKFATSVVRKFHNKRLSGKMMERPVTKLEIAEALGYRESWLKEAERGHSYIENYGDDEEVKAEVEKVYDSPPGSARLKTFLKDHHLSHREATDN